MLRSPPEVRRIAAALPQSDPALVRDLLALAGPDLAVALANLAAAIGTLAGQRVAASAQPLVLGAAAHVIANTALLHAQRPAGRG